MRVTLHVLGVLWYLRYVYIILFLYNMTFADFVVSVMNKYPESFVEIIFKIQCNSSWGAD